MGLVRKNEWKRQPGASLPCFWVSGHCLGTPVPCSDHDGLDAKPATGSLGKAGCLCLYPPLKMHFWEALGWSTSTSRCNWGGDLEVSLVPQSLKHWHNPHKVYLQIETMTAFEKVLIPTTVKTASALGEGVCSTFSLRSASGLYNSRPCMPRDTASVGKSYKTFTLSSPSQCLPCVRSPGEKARKERRELNPQSQAAGTQQRAALGDALFLPYLQAKICSSRESPFSPGETEVPGWYLQTDRKKCKKKKKEYELSLLLVFLFVFWLFFFFFLLLVILPMRARKQYGQRLHLNTCWATINDVGGFSL